jgi:hypothetical protein
MNTGNKLSLPEVTVFTFCWGDEHVLKSLKSMCVAMDQVNFGRNVLITDTTKTNIKIFEKIIDRYDIDVCDTSLDLGQNMQNDDSNRHSFCYKFLHETKNFITGDFSLNIQHDSTIIDSTKWEENFLKYDYIAAPWPMSIIQATDMVNGQLKDIPNVVGNGGFSLRSRKFVEESVDLPWKHKNEDLNICIFNYQNMVDKGVQFAPPQIAARFSVEHPTPYKNFNRNMLFTYGSFGFHGEFNKAGMDFINRYKTILEGQKV